MLKTPIAHDIITDALKNCTVKRGKIISYHEIAENLDIPISSVWFPMNGKRAWSADRWLMTLQALGCLSYCGDHIIISSSKLKKYSKLFSNPELI